MRQPLTAYVGSFLALGLALVSIHQVRLRGPLTFSRTPTILSHSTTDPRTAQRALLFLSRAGDHLPPEATVAFVRAGHRTWQDDENAFMTAIGFLPHQDVRTALDLTAPDGPLPEYVVSFEGDFPDARYVPAWRDPDGAIYRHIR